ncbi:DEAD/DEAH box helicase [Schaalia georgiae]|uniref:DEAD/DEAH box helicase n=1 Tax=Schaalia georgiae TaxID=52768 RepID=UPI00041A6FFB|nr:DEAD/DEAH box helicase [Schaalia georgiae]
MSPKRKRRRAQAPAAEPLARTGPWQGSPAQRYAAFKEQVRVDASERARWTAALPFTPDAFQVEALDAVEAGASAVLVAAPTGAGKTVVGDFGAHMARRGSMRAYYTTPIKALSNQKYLELSDMFGADQVGLATGDTSINPGAPIVVMTTEVLRNMIYAGAGLSDLAVVVLDEVHYLSDRMRGPVWEEVIIHLPRHVQIIALSATVSNAEEFGAWMGEVRGGCAVVVSEERPVPLYQHMVVGDEIIDLYTPSGALNPRLVQLTAPRSRRPVGAAGRRGAGGGPRGGRRRESRPSTLVALDRAGLLPAITFVFSRAGCEDAVRQVVASGITLTSRATARRISEYVDGVVRAIAPEDYQVLGVDAWRDALVRGVAAHHAGMLPLMKEAVEHLFSQGLISMVYATETLALGINMPARTVVIESLQKWNGSSRAPLSAGEYTQLSGRAGRRGIDTEGHAVVSHRGGAAPEEVAALASKRTYPLVSAFRPTYNMVVNLLEHSTVEQARELLESSFAQFQADRAVVSLASRLRDARARAGALRGDLACQYGDALEYCALRDRISRAEKEGARRRRVAAGAGARAVIDSARPGDVLAFRAGRRVRHVVVAASARAADGRTALRAVTMDAKWRTLTPHDFAGGVRMVGRMALPGAGGPRGRKGLVRLAAELVRLVRSGALAPFEDARGDGDDADELRTRMRAHPVHRCPHREEHARAGAAWAKADREAASLARAVESRTHSVVKQFDRVRRVLESLGFLDGDRVTARGQQLRRVYGERDLVIAEALASGAWEGLDAPALAAIVSACVYESRGDGASALPAGLGPASRRAWEETSQVAARVARAEAAAGVDASAPLDPALMAACSAWAHGSTLATALADSGIAGGDFVRWTRQVIDALGQIESVEPAGRVGASARRARSLLARGVVAWSGVEER